MQKLTSKIKRFFNADDQKLYKAGLIDECHTLTSRGDDELDLIVREANKEPLVAVAEELIKEDKEENK